MLSPEGVEAMEYTLPALSAWTYSESETSTNPENGPMLTLTSKTSPPFATEPMPIGLAWEGSELPTGSATASYTKTSEDVGIETAPGPGVGTGTGVGVGVDIGVGAGVGVAPGAGVGVGVGVGVGAGVGVGVGVDVTALIAAAIL